MYYYNRKAKVENVGQFKTIQVVNTWTNSLYLLVVCFKHGIQYLYGFLLAIL